MILPKGDIGKPHEFPKKLFCKNFPKHNPGGNSWMKSPFPAGKPSAPADGAAGETRAGLWRPRWKGLGKIQGKIRWRAGGGMEPCGEQGKISMGNPLGTAVAPPGDTKGGWKTPQYSRRCFLGAAVQFLGHLCLQEGREKEYWIFQGVGIPSIPSCHPEAFPVP